MADDALIAQVMTLSAVIASRTQAHRDLVPYDEGGTPIPTAVVQGKLTKAYRALMPTAEAPWGSLVVDSVQDRLEVAGVRDVEGNEKVADAVWGAWQDNAMDSESKLGHRSALLDGRAFALVWPDETGKPEITLDDCTQMVVQYQPGSRRKRVAALRQWVEGGRVNATLYRADGLFKFESVSDNGEVPSEASGWRRRRAADGKPLDPWPTENPWKVVPAVEVAVNRRLKPGEFGYARGEFEHCTGLIDRINLLTFLGLVVAVWMGFPLRGVIGAKIEWLKDDDGNLLLDPGGKPQSKPPFESRPDSVFQFENPQASMYEFKAADRSNLSVFAELDQLAVITKTPRHYFPLQQGMSNLSADAIRASEGGLHAKVTGHKASLGEGWEEVLRVAGAMLETPVVLSPRAELVWKDHESRSLAERADAAVKLASIAGIPWQAVAEIALNATGDTLTRWEAATASNGFANLIRAVDKPGTNGVPQVPA